MLVFYSIIFGIFVPPLVVFLFGYLSTFQTGSLFLPCMEQAVRLEQGEITAEEYDQWRYKYPELDTSKQWRKVIPSQELSDLILQDLKPESN